MADVVGTEGGQVVAGNGTGAAEPQTMLGEGAGSQTLLAWQSTLPENLRADPTVQKYGTLEQAARALVEQNKLIGRGIYLPDEAATPEAKLEAMNRVYDKLGRPKDAASYELPTPSEDVPDGLKWDTAFEQDFRQEAYAAGMTQAQVAAMVGVHQKWVGGMKNVIEARKAASYGEGLAGLQKEFGATTQQRIDQAVGFFDEFGRGRFGGEKGITATEAFKEAILPDGTLLRNVPSVVAAFAEAFNRLAEAPFLTSDAALSGLSNSESLNAKALELTQKYTDGTITPQESQQLQQINRERARLREQQATTGRR